VSERPIDGVVVTELEPRHDDRGSFVELFRGSWFAGSRPMMQANLSVSRAGVLRGMHFHRHQADYWCVIDGIAFVALFDLRMGSPSHRIGASFTFDAGSGLRGLYVPAGVAHGFAALTAVRLQYVVDGEFTGDDEYGIAWDDPDLGIAWPLDGPVLSDRDRANPSLASALADAPPFAERSQR
jgi:dTDP-4-dehydrorhamnose 3,5-epimerase